nr:hypothetical protein CFP56_39634 [Quercus suber]
MLQVSFVLLIISSIPCAISDIKDKHIVDDSRKTFAFQRFGFLKDGHALISIKDISWKSKTHKAQLNLNSMGFYIYKSSFLFPIIMESISNNYSCILSSKYVQVLSTFEKLTTNSSAYNVSTAIDEPDEYILSFCNCQPEFEVSMYVHTEMYNLKHGEKEFLSAGKTNLPILYFLLTALLSSAYCLQLALQLTTFSLLSSAYYLQPFSLLPSAYYLQLTIFSLLPSTLQLTTFSLLPSAYYLQLTTFSLPFSLLPSAYYFQLA